VIRFDLPAEDGGTALCWTLTVADPAPDASLVGHLRKRIDQLINADLRYRFGN
jgi:hypothetical protein